MSDFTLSRSIYSEPYDPDQYCACGCLLDAWTKPVDHDPLCEYHPDQREDLAELDAVDVLKPVGRKGEAA